MYAKPKARSLQPVSLLVRIARLSLSLSFARPTPYCRTMHWGLHIVVYIYASRHKSSFKSHSGQYTLGAWMLARSHTDANGTTGRLFANGTRARFVTDNARSSLNLTSLRADQPLRTKDRPTTNLYYKWDLEDRYPRETTSSSNGWYPMLHDYRLQLKNDETRLIDVWFHFWLILV